MPTLKAKKPTLPIFQKYHLDQLAERLPTYSDSTILAFRNGYKTITREFVEWSRVIFEKDGETAESLFGRDFLEKNKWEDLIE
jgi:hypothetical protein